MLGYGSSELTKGVSSTIAKFGIRTAFSSTAGAASKAVIEGSRYLQGGAVSAGSFVKAGRSCLNIFIIILNKF